ncbi:hypothetical protein [Sphingobacterium zeae]|uniref:hypothetical protein n=1 Tax=Sphingobacterium zeae TaxID=1776859 RepID=UPI0036102ECF
MRIKLTLILLLSLLLNRVIGQVISGEANPCPETNYTYSFSGPSFGNYFLWSITDGQIISQNSNTVVVRWYNKVTENGKWKLRVQYETIKFDGTSGGSTYLDKDVKVNIPSRYVITGDREIPGDFRGSKTYTAQIVNSNFPAATFVWTTNTGIQTTTTTPSFNVNITDDQLKWITVAGKSSTCPQWGETFKFDIVYTPVFTGPSSICSEGIYTITSPGTITLENASGIATLTALGNNQWKVTRIGSANGIVKLRSTSNGKTFDKDIIVGVPASVVAIAGPTEITAPLGLAVKDETFSIVQGVAGATYEWSIIGSNNIIFANGNTGNSIVVHVKKHAGTTPYNCKMKVKVITECGTSDYINYDFKILPGQPGGGPL